VNKKKTLKVKKKKKVVTTNKKKNKKYFDFTSRLVFNVISFIFLLVVGTFLLNKSLKFESEQIVNYDEKSSIDYRVYLLENDFYEEEYLSKDMIYVASLIDKISLDFDYTFEIEDNENLDFTYSILGKLSITNKEGTRSYFEKVYTLLSDKTINMTNSNYQRIHEQIDLDYGYYNRLANSFNTSYAIDTDSTLTVYMIINKKNTLNSDFEINSDSYMNIIIPLSERSVDITLDYQEINSNSSIVKEKGISIANIIMLIIAIVLIVLSIVLMIKLMRKISLISSKKNAYDKYVNKILKEYDRLIAETSTLINFKDKEIIKINKFSELLDIHDNLQLPIMYYLVIKHQKCYFYISHNDTIYLVTIKAVDLEIEKNSTK